MTVRGAAFLGIGAMVGAGIFALLVFFAIDTLDNAPETSTAIVAIAVLAIVLDLIWKRSSVGPACIR